MAPSDKKLEAELLKTVRDVFKKDSNQLSVNCVRKHVEENLGLDDGFFSSQKWKNKSKTLIKELAEELLSENAEPGPASPQPKDDGEDKDAESKNAAKRQSSDTSPPPKRRKRATASQDKEADEIDSNADEPKIKKKAPPRKKVSVRKKASSGVDSENESSPAKPKAFKDGNRRANKKDDEAVGESGSDDLSTPPESEDEKVKSEAEKSQDDELSTTEKKRGNKLAEQQPEAADEMKSEEQVVVDDSSSELSELIDEAPKPKRRKKEATAGSKTARQKKAHTVENADDAEIKKLQSQLVKCGIRKIWGFELKQYGDNTKAKIKHLKDMLKDIGMDGRFSEARAREIKERRELEADLEAVQEMNANWGAGGRSSRSKARAQPSKMAAKEQLSEEDESAQEDDDEEEEAVVSSRARGKARADLAFLGDDDEDSD
ncbi:hypothetical protein CCHL11_03314 [Colletotrichum chlorophyti]|uniref:HIRA-interacting protein 3 n=1 Tax=Colletotrichum chlorophyti TaxID=708187 RepID=A0A1Q8S430_9PEZI|nr:hypothetical protein CCHL11_03314 [Colletotrichum chlorophyti]